MFGSNVIAGQKEFKNAPLSSLLVTSIFATLQGEGPLSGRPSVFVRLAKCNLACSFCDTYFDKGQWMTFDEIAKRAAISNTALPNSSFLDKGWNLVVTGGEPTLQPDLTGFLLSQTGLWEDIQIETNGLVDRQLPLSTILVVSPKCSEPNNGSRSRFLKPQPRMLDRADCLKFVVDSDPESPYHKPPDWALQWKRETKRPIYISPMNHYQEGKAMKMLTVRENQATTFEQRTANEVVSFWTPGLLDQKRNEANHMHAATLCLQYGYWLSLQTHLYAGLA